VVWRSLFFEFDFHINLHLQVTLYAIISILYSYICIEPIYRLISKSFSIIETEIVLFSLVGTIQENRVMCWKILEHRKPYQAP